MRIGVTGLVAVVTLVAAACGGGAAEHPSTSSLASGWFRRQRGLQ
jgi:hypothetical protein